MVRWAAVLLLFVLAGCAGDDAVVEPPADDQVEDNDLPPELRYQPGFKSRTGGYVNGTDVAFYCDTFANSTVAIDANKTFDGGAHSHDMWKGQDSLVIFEGLVDSFAGGNWFFMPGAVVHPGAGRAEFTLDWDQRPGLEDGRLLRLDMPGDDRPGFPDADMVTLRFDEPGQTQSVDFSFLSNDRPHAERTSWSFKMTGTSAATEPLPDGVPYSLVKDRVNERPATIKWEIFREYDCLPLDPPHYEYWNTTTSKTVLEVEHTLDWTQTPIAGSGVFYSLQCSSLFGNGTVPPGTGTVVVTISWQNQELVPGKFGLLYHGSEWRPCSTTREWKQPPVTEDGANQRTYVLDVHPLEADSPYAERSNWDFGLYYDELGHDDINGIGKFRGTVTWHVEAFKPGYGP